MASAMKALIITSLSIGFVHTLIGPDHYVPFIALAKARRWTLRRTISVTFLCGLGHVFSSVILGLIGIAFGVAVAKLQDMESIRGSVAAWILLAFGLAYTLWGLFEARRGGRHAYLHAHGTHVHPAGPHDHQGQHVPGSEDSPHGETTPWALFIIFVLGPCEPLIPILMYPAATMNLWGLAIVTAAFGFATIMTILAMVIALTLGISTIPSRGLIRYGHALAGAAILISGIAIKVGL